MKNISKKNDSQKVASNLDWIISYTLAIGSAVSVIIFTILALFDLIAALFE